MKSKGNCNPFALAGRMKALVSAGGAVGREKRKELFANSSLLGDTHELEAILSLKPKWNF